jgi:hypothetical protein
MEHMVFGGRESEAVSGNPLRSEIGRGPPSLYLFGETNAQKVVLEKRPTMDDVQAL